MLNGISLTAILTMFGAFAILFIMTLFAWSMTKTSKKRLHNKKLNEARNRIKNPQPIENIIIEDPCEQLISRIHSKKVGVKPEESYYHISQRSTNHLYA